MQRLGSGSSQTKTMEAPHNDVAWQQLVHHVADETCETIAARWQCGEAEQKAFTAWPLSAARYSIQKKLGCGAFAAAFAAVRSSDFEEPTHVALKVVPRFDSAASRELDVMLALREAEASGNRGAKSIVSLEEYFFVEAVTAAAATTEAVRSVWSLVMVLPQFDCNLVDYIFFTQDFAPRLPLACHVGGQLASALAHVHALGIVHRDIKADNVLINKNHADFTRPTAVLADFGHAKRVMLKDEPATASDDDDGANCAYAFARSFRAPELFYGSAQYDFAPDVWAFGCTIAEVLLDGEQLFRPPGGVDEDDDASATVHLRLNRSQRQLHRLIAALGTPSWDELVAMNPALAYDPERKHKWLRLPPREAHDPWQSRVQTALESQEAKHLGGPQWYPDAKQAMEILEGIFKYEPAARPTTEILAQQFEEWELTWESGA